MDTARIGEALALVNAGLNGLSAVFLIAGYVFVRQQKLHLHRRAMISALTASALFLVFYLTRVALTGTHEFAGEGIAKTVYLTVLLSHMLLAVVIVPLVLRLVYLVGKRRCRAQQQAQGTQVMFVEIRVMDQPYNHGGNNSTCGNLFLLDQYAGLFRIEFFLHHGPGRDLGRTAIGEIFCRCPG